MKLPNKELIEQPISQEMYYKIHPDKRPHVHVQVTLDLDADGQITIEGQSRTDEQVSQWLLEKPETERRETLVIIRAVKGTPTGAVQRVIKLCQSVKCEKFALRAKKPEE